MSGEYRFKAHPTRYAGVEFRSRLEARWASFFNLADWGWRYEAVDLYGWTPDFWVSFPCGHSECGPTHQLFAEVKPYFAIDAFKGHRCLDFPYGGYDERKRIPADASAAFGIDPSVSYWEMAHGAGGGEESIPRWVPEWESLWNEAGNVTQWRPNRL